MPDDADGGPCVNVSSQGDGKENDLSRVLSSCMVWSGRAPEAACLEVRLNSTKKPDDLGEEHPVRGTARQVARTSPGHIAREEVRASILAAVGPESFP